MIKENTKAPDFKLPSTNKRLLSLKDLKDKFLIIFFYPKDDTPGCTVEANDFNKLLLQFKKLNCEVFGVSKIILKVMINLGKNINLNLTYYPMKN